MLNYQKHSNVDGSKVCLSMHVKNTSQMYFTASL